MTGSPPPQIHASQFPIVPSKSVPTFRREDNSIPEWCGLPVPGIWLSVSLGDKRRPTKFPIDTKRMYTISGQGSFDICIPELDDKLICLYHHRNGSLYISSKSFSVDKVDGGSSLPVTNIPSVLGDESQIHIGNICMSVFRRVSNISIREALSHADTEDDTTRQNTYRNQKRCDIVSPFPKLVSSLTPASRTPGSQRRRRKRLRNVTNTVKFADFDF